MPSAQIDALVKSVNSKAFDFVTYNTYNTYNKPAEPKKEIRVSIVMTTYNRKGQTLYTLKSIQSQKLSTVEIEVIIIDDSTKGYLSAEDLSVFPFQITYITIDSKRKTWINPCVNYNIGFQEVTGDIIVIQNAEVCHCGAVWLGRA